MSSFAKPVENSNTFLQNVLGGCLAASVTAVFSSVLYSQTSSQKCVLQRATFATVRCMRRRWSISMSWMPPYRRLLSAKACSSNRATSLHRTVRTIYITTQVLISPEETNSLRPSWLTGDLNHIENRKQGFTPTMFPIRFMRPTLEHSLRFCRDRYVCYFGNVSCRGGL